MKIACRSIRVGRERPFMEGRRCLQPGLVAYANHEIGEDAAPMNAAVDPHDDYFRDEAPPPKRRAILSLPAILGASFVVWHATHSPGLAATTMCLKFGWDDISTALWLRRRDPHPARRKANFLALPLERPMEGRRDRDAHDDRHRLHVGPAAGEEHGRDEPTPTGAGLPRSRTRRRQPNRQPNADEGRIFQAAFMTAFFAFTLSAFASYIALFHAWRNRLQLWLNSSVRLARETREWPPLYGRTNFAFFLFFTTLMVTSFVIMPLGVILFRAGVAGRRLRGAAGRSRRRRRPHGHGRAAGRDLHSERLVADALHRLAPGRLLVGSADGAGEVSDPETPPLTPSPKRRGGTGNCLFLFPLSASGRGLGGGVARGLFHLLNKK